MKGHDTAHRRRGAKRGRGKRLFDYGELRLLVLSMIQDKPRHGYELIKEISERFDGRYTPSPGVIYPTLTWLEDTGYISLTVAQGGRKLSRLTPEGESYLVANAAAVAQVLTRRPPDGPSHVRSAVIEEAMDALKRALGQRLSDAQITEGQLAEIAAHIRTAAQVITPTRKDP